MPEFCSCGAQLPPDALFCHKCGKPQREILPAEVPQTVESETVPPPRAGVPLNFRNAVAVRIALVVGAGSALLSLILPLLNVFAGFFAVFLYVRRTGLLLNVGSGVKLGWITGVLAFPLYTILFIAIQFPRMSSTLSTVMLERIRTLGDQDPAMTQQMIQFVQSAPGMALLTVLYLLAMFVIMTLLSMAGGALGAKMVGRP